MSNTRNTQKAPVKTTSGFDRSKVVKLETGFDPYWSPEIGKEFVGRALMIDYRDPMFVRIQFEAGEVTQCEEGDAKNAKPVTVQPGGTFTTSIYGAMAKEFLFHLWQSQKDGIPTPMCLVDVPGMGVVKKGEFAGKDFYRFNIQTMPEDKARLTSHREEFNREFGGLTAKQLFSGQRIGNPVNARPPLEETAGSSAPA